jgi:hypothetical protein
MKVAEPQILGRLQDELQRPVSVAYITKSLERELVRTLRNPPGKDRELRRQLDEERRKVQNLIAAIEGGSTGPAALLQAVSDREARIRHLERELRREERTVRHPRPPDLQEWVRRQLNDLTAVLKDDPSRVKAEFRRLNLELTFEPVEAEPRPHYVVRGRCDLSPLAVSYLQVRREGAVLDRLLGSRARARSSSRGRFTSSVGGGGGRSWR